MSSFEEKEFHEVVHLFPQVQPDELDRLAEDIKDNGLISPIWLHPDGRIIDGRTRYTACKMVGVAPHYKTWSGEGSLVSFVVSINLHRRHLTDSQRAMVGVQTMMFLEEEADARRRLTQNNSAAEEKRAEVVNLPPQVDWGKSREKAAELVMVSPSLIQHAKKVRDAGSDALKEAVVRGEVAVSAASKLATLPKPEQTRVVNSGRQALRDELKKLREPDQQTSQVVSSKKEKSPELKQVLKLLKSLSREELLDVQAQLRELMFAA